jgi:hypothetical protein
MGGLSREGGLETGIRLEEVGKGGDANLQGRRRLG